MNLPARHLVALCAAAGLLLTGCSAADDTETGTESEPAASPTDAGTAAATDAPTEAAVETGGACEVEVTGGGVPVDTDEAGSQAALEGVTLSAADAATTVSFEAPLAIGTEVVRVAAEGSGDAAEDGHLITFNYVVCDMVTGEKMYSTWGLAPEDDAPETYIVSSGTFGEALSGAFVGATPGTQVLWAQPGVSAEESSTGEAQNGYLYAMTVTGTQPVPAEASGAEVTPTDATLPQISFVDGKPAVTVPETFTDPTELVVQPLIQGEGAAVEAGQTVIVKYTGWLTDGTQFDSSWERESPNDVFSFSVGHGQVIPGWDQGVEGQPVGSRLLLVIPSELGYGAEGSGETIPADSTLVFVVDILAAY